jgi:hypothetical protein
MNLKNYRNHLQNLLLDGFFLDHDALLWIPSLEALASDEWEAIIPPSDYLRTVGTMAIAKLTIAAVEQYAEQHKLNEGSIEKMRAIAALLFFEMSAKTSLVNGQSLMLSALKDDFPDIMDWHERKLNDLTSIAKSTRSEAAGKALGALRMIEQQQQPKRRGNQGDRPKGFMSDAAAQWYDLAISKVIHMAAQNVKNRSPLEPATVHIVRSEIRQVVKGAVALGQFVDDLEYEDQGNDKNLLGLIEVITKKALRRFDADTRRYVKEGKLIVPTKPAKKTKI